MSLELSQPLDLFNNIEQIKKRLSGKRILIFLDYDGTLTPIVNTPDRAVLSEEMSCSLKELCGLYKVSIVSGRATDDVRGKVGIGGIFYAGSHGFEIIEPNGHVEINEEAQKIRHEVLEIHTRLVKDLKPVKGALVEDVKYTISTHYRLVDDEDVYKVKDAVDAVLGAYTNFRVTHGKKVFEIRPKIDWDKGRAVDWILKVLDYDSKNDIAIYIGDDTTDEDAFKTLDGKGFGVLVAQEARNTKAVYRIKDQVEVKAFLDLLIELKNIDS